jgi:hypothetical protein
MTEVPDERSFEWLREKVLQLRPAAKSAERDLVWADAEHTLAVAREPEGRLEIFLLGDELQAATRPVRERLEYQVWNRAAGEPITANRLVLPHADGFDGAAAFVCAELVANGYHDVPASAFALTEPVIAMLLRRATTRDDVLVGLVGELLVLRALLAATPPAGRTELLGSWAGSAPSSRDFQIADIGVEVKTTTGPTSKHHIQGFHQVETGVSVGGVPEAKLFLLSLGISWLPAGTSQGWSVSSLVEATLALLAEEQDRDDLRFKVRQYGGEGGQGYDHVKDRELPRFTRRFTTRFERLYDLADPAIRLLRRPDIEPFDAIDPESVAYSVDLPKQVTGDLNPVVGLPSAVGAVLNSAGFGHP